ncbi:IPT/TIG domain-containing protein [Paractinoplanes bogorensis]|uniref:IPT/TIG domain-containing protein n=1 Tax=Paractinoplanes bogorensis TaxID=1610840 RepID=UPI0027E00DCD|nr:IPT/TIG domain-containing protein [Actinoplanes bogorensis]
MVLTTAAVVAVAEPAWADPLPLTLNVSVGPSGARGTLVGTVAATSAPFPVGTTPTVQFQYIGGNNTACSATARPVTQIAISGITTTAGALTVDPATVRRIGTNKIAFDLPTSAYPATDSNGDPSTVNYDGLVLLGDQSVAKWSVCVYDTDSTVASTLLAAGTYTLAQKPVITSIVPAASAAGGGQSITVNGTGLGSATTTTTASIDGVPLTNLQVAANGSSFTAVTGPHAAGTNLDLVVTAPGGKVSSLDPDNNGLPEDNDNSTADTPIPFSYSNGITISPNTSALGTTVDVDIVGAGFSQLSFDPNGDPYDANAHVFLVNGKYDAATNRGVAECGAVSVVNDTELICTLDLSLYALDPATSLPASPNGPIAEGAYILTIVANGGPGVGVGAAPTMVSSSATFTVASY